jgi:hypothetical protein
MEVATPRRCVLVHEISKLSALNIFWNFPDEKRKEQYARTVVAEKVTMRFLKEHLSMYDVRHAPRNEGNAVVRG